jgi:hypothetical protein
MRWPTRTVWGWAALALVGLVIACGAAYAASRLATQPVGLSDEPINAGEDLAPRTAPTPTPTPTVTVTATPSATPAPSHDDSGHGRGRGRGRGRGGDDD